jgi:predicted Zn-dependent protease with MMP-like domain
MHLSRSQFEEIVAEALDRMPARFAEMMSNVAIQVQEVPDPETLLELELDPVHDTLYGLYTGVPLDQRGGWYGNVLPDMIVLYRRPLLASSRSRRGLVRQIQLTLLHEVGHHLGFSDAEMDAWEREFEGLGD